MNKDIRAHTAAGTVWKCFNWLSDKGNPGWGWGTESQGGKGHGDPRSRSAQGLGTVECLPGMCQALGSTSSMVEVAGVEEAQSTWKERKWGHGRERKEER